MRLGRVCEGPTSFLSKSFQVSCFISRSTFFTKEHGKNHMKVLSFPEDEGISPEIGGISHYNGSISCFIDPSRTSGSSEKGGSLLTPCGEAGSSQAAIEAAKAEYMANIAITGKLPSPRNNKPSDSTHLVKQKAFKGCVTNSQGKESTKSTLDTSDVSSPRRKIGVESPVEPISCSSDARHTPIQPRKTGDLKSGENAPLSSQTSEEAAAYYRSLPKNTLSKEEMWERIRQSKIDSDQRLGSAISVSEADYLRIEEELKEHDLFHFRLGELAYEDQQTRWDYYSMWALAMSLNKARWTMLDVHSQRGVKTTGAGMKLMFWKESVNEIMEKRKMVTGQFTDSHPVLRPFASTVEKHPKMTKAFVRGFTDARLKVIQQPGSVKQLFDHFDKFYGYFYNSLLEITNVNDEHAEHLMQHIGRATGLTQHCVMFWKKYAQIGFTMLPADLCADNHVNLALLKNIPLASRDRAVRRLLFDVMSICKTEMLHAQQVAPLVSPKAWPIVMECLYANYYLGFLQRRDFNVSAMFADHNIENAGFAWYRVKKRMEWERYQSIERLVAETAPFPFIGRPIFDLSSKYKVATGMGAKQHQK